jgi:hypothetical protein
MGMNGGGSDNLMVGCLLISNNVKGYSKGWEAGGIKIANSRRFHVDRCLAVKNDGPGFWFDIDNRDEIIERCYAAENYGPGVFVEISKTASVRNNLCVRNGLKDEPGAWGHSGILLGEAMQCLVENNVCVGNRSGIAVRQQNLRTLKPDPKRGRETEKRYYSQGHVFRHNISAFNRDWQFVLFGDNPFFGPHPSKLAAEQTEMPPSLMALHDPAQREWRMEQNLYYRGDGKGLICWGAPWRPKHLSYEDISAFQRACNLNLEQDSLVADPQFINRQGGNFALSPDSPAKRLGAGFTAPPADPAALEAVK